MFEIPQGDPVDPAPQMASRLQESIGPRGSVLAWNKSFEARCNQTIARLVPEYREFFDDITERLVDLMDVFKLGYYLHPDFRGSASLKNVLPVLVPELTYKNLTIGDGSAAMLAWWELVFGDMETGQRDALESALRAYSQQDVAAMVAIWKVLDAV